MYPPPHMTCVDAGIDPSLSSVALYYGMYSGLALAGDYIWDSISDSLFGPIRLPIPATTLRSNHTMSIVATRPVTNTTKTFSTTMSNGVHRRSPFSTGSMASNEIMRVSLFAHQQCLRVHRKLRGHHCQVD